MSIATTKWEDLRPPYDVVYADPPWLHYGSPDKDQAAGKHYKCMSEEELSALQVWELLQPKSGVLLCWSTSSKIVQAVGLFQHWGLYYRGIHQIWVKTTKAGKIIHGQGVRPSFIKPTAEYLLIAAQTPRGRPMPLMTEAMQNVVLEPRPGNKHSKKPARFRADVKNLFGDVRCVELFGREAIPGWDVWGNEAA